MADLGFRWVHLGQGERGIIARPITVRISVSGSFLYVCEVLTAIPDGLSHNLIQHIGEVSAGVGL